MIDVADPKGGTHSTHCSFLGPGITQLLLAAQSPEGSGQPDTCNVLGGSWTGQWRGLTSPPQGAATSGTVSAFASPSAPSPLVLVPHQGLEPQDSHLLSGALCLALAIL